MKGVDDLKCKFQKIAQKPKFCNENKNLEHENVDLRNWIWGSRSFLIKIAIFPLFQFKKMFFILGIVRKDRQEKCFEGKFQSDF